MTVRYCGRDFTEAELETIRLITTQYPHRKAISVAVCEALEWRKPDGGWKDMSARVALLRMQEDGLISLPAPTRKVGYSQRTEFTAASDPGAEIVGSRGDLPELTLKRVENQNDSRLWRELVARYHYLGYHPLPGAQIRYLVLSEGRILAALGFGASAWKVKPRDEFIGWSIQQRETRLHLVVNNARFLILPWIRVKYLASSILGLVAKRLGDDWERIYHYRPVLLETFVEEGRFAGTSYRAANWIRVGRTQGRGKKDRYNQFGKPVKEVYLYPLQKDFRETLCREDPPPTAPPDGEGS